MRWTRLMRKPQDDLGTWLAGGLIVLAVGGAIAGLALVGGPGEARDTRTDRALIDALFQSEIVLACHHASKGVVPSDEAELRALIEEQSSGKVPAAIGNADEAPPEICRRVPYFAGNIPKERFSYRRISADSGEVCLDFKGSRADRLRRGVARESNAFGNLAGLETTAGRQCFMADFSA